MKPILDACSILLIRIGTITSLPLCATDESEKLLISFSPVALQQWQRTVSHTRQQAGEADEGSLLYERVGAKQIFNPHFTWDQRSIDRYVTKRNLT
ncbi:hypothetical protein EDD16DRAFT_1587875 [Pisolithus croceorrhizus]|nr:hypothetical protein EV401DRAFT_2021401 [Pisolithus croceorrhizus]KAI6117585.1 hypothetical protein EDD16DRAFT_1587875 [Pisolithus croceorrhizus]